MIKFFRAVTAFIIVIFVVFISFYSLIPHEKAAATELDAWKKLGKIALNSDPTERIPVPKEAVTDVNSLPLRDNTDLYKDDKPDSVVVMYVTVRKGDSASTSGATWGEVNSFRKVIGEINNPPRAEAILQIGDEIGPLPGELGYAEQIPNASISVRGNTSTYNDQKSYKIELHGKLNKWRGQQSIDLNKHIYDASRVTQKLSFDMMKQIPGMVSLRTQFVHLYVKDETATPASAQFKDYGLFTQVEQPNKAFLKNHLLDPNGQLYKATFFEFLRYPDAIRLVSDPLYDEAEFSKILEIKGDKDHSKLIKMLDDVNNYDIPIETTFEKYFNKDNYLTWLAFNILVGNIDTSSQNFLLYSPQNGTKWYFIPWDYDGSFARLDTFSSQSSQAPWRVGFTTYWGVTLHKRVLAVAEYRQLLNEKIHELNSLFPQDKVKSMLALYNPVITKYVSQMPDMLNIEGNFSGFTLRYSQIADEMPLNFKLYEESLGKPMPFFLGTPAPNGDNIEFHWESSMDLNRQKVSYHFMVAGDPDFKNILVDKPNLLATSVKINQLKPGSYYWRVEATNEDDKSAVAFDSFDDENGVRHFGVKFLYVTPEGNLLESKGR